jgi:hypothetical protein
MVTGDESTWRESVYSSKDKAATVMQLSKDKASGDCSAQGGQEWATGECRVEGLQEGVTALA